MTLPAHAGNRIKVETRAYMDKTYEFRYFLQFDPRTTDPVIVGADIGWHPDPASQPVPQTVTCSTSMYVTYIDGSGHGAGSGIIHPVYAASAEDRATVTVERFLLHPALTVRSIQAIQGTMIGGNIPGSVADTDWQYYFPAVAGIDD